jgi:ankyrin repeat protein
MLERIFNRESKKKQKERLFVAIVDGDLEAVKTVIKTSRARANDWLEPFTLNEKPLHLAVRHGKSDIVEFLLAHGVDVLEPFCVGGYEFALSEVATASGFPSLARRLSQLEAEAELIQGKRTLTRPPACGGHRGGPNFHD